MTSHEPLQPSVQPGSLLDAAINLNISILINRAHFAIQNLQYETARIILKKAINIAAELQKPTIPRARCYFWLGVLVERIGEEDLAPEMFGRAMHCIGHSREGNQVIPYVLKYGNSSQILKAIQNTEQDEETKQEWRDALRQAEGSVRNEHTLFAEMLRESPATYKHHSLPWARRESLDNEDAEAALHRLIRDDDDHNMHIFQHEVKTGSRERPKALSDSIVLNSHPETGLTKALPMGSRQGAELSLLDRSGNIKDRPSLLPLPNFRSVEVTRGEALSQSKATKRSSSTRIPESLKSNPILRSLPKKFLTPIETQKHAQSSEPETTSPLRKASLPGEDLTMEQEPGKTH